MAVVANMVLSNHQSINQPICIDISLPHNTNVGLNISNTGHNLESWSSQKLTRTWMRRKCITRILYERTHYPAAPLIYYRKLSFRHYHNEGQPRFEGVREETQGALEDSCCPLCCWGHFAHWVPFGLWVVEDDDDGSLCHCIVALHILWEHHSLKNCSKGGTTTSHQWSSEVWSCAFAVVGTSPVCSLCTIATVIRSYHGGDMMYESGWMGAWVGG